MCIGIECFTQKNWSHLEKESQKLVPFQLVARVKLEGLKTSFYRYYEGNHFRIYASGKKELIDLETRLRIEEVSYFCLKNNNLFSLKNFGLNLTLVDNISRYFFDSLNYYAGARDPSNLAKIQKICSECMLKPENKNLWDVYYKKNRKGGD